MVVNYGTIKVRSILIRIAWLWHFLTSLCSKILFSITYVFMYGVFLYVHTTAHIWQAEDKFKELVPSFHHRFRGSNSGHPAYTPRAFTYWAIFRPLPSILTKTKITVPMMDFRDVGQGVPGSLLLFLITVRPLWIRPSLYSIIIHIYYCHIRDKWLALTCWGDEAKIFALKALVAILSLPFKESLM